MPTLKWELKDPDSCEGCPCLEVSARKDEYYRSITYQAICRVKFVIPNSMVTDKFLELKRPQACKDELGQ